MRSLDRIKLCIIDDIRIVVNGLMDLDWTGQEIEIAGTASNGEDGLELIRLTKPDIIITDIRMPRMDGLTMVSAILDLKFTCKVILITGYTDFEYAKQAVQLGAFDFVVKPFTEEQIMDTVLRAKQEILQERSKLMSIQDMEHKLRESLPLLRQEYMALLINHPTPWEQIARRWEFLKIELTPHSFHVILFEIDGFMEQIGELSVHDVELIRFSIQNITEETIKSFTNCIVFRAKHNRFAAVLNSYENIDVTQIAEQCCKNIERYSNFTISVGIGGSVQHVLHLPDSYRQAERAIAYHLITGGNGAISYEVLPTKDRQAPLVFEKKDELLLALRSGSSKRVISILSDISEALHRLENQPNPDYLISLYDELAATAMRTCYELIPAPDIEPLVDLYKSMREKSGITQSALEQMLSTLCISGADLVRLNTHSEGQILIYKSIDYLMSHLDRDVTVSDCATHANLSVSYYSSLFKKVTGMTFVQYANNERIQKAKNLLVAGLPVQEVSAAVGYEERRYFSEMFKKVTGMTPSEFRASYHPDANNSSS